MEALRVKEDYERLVEHVCQLVQEGFDDDQIACQKALMTDIVEYVRINEMMLKDGEWVRRCRS